MADMEVVKKRGRPAGMKMTDEQKKAMAAKRAEKKAEANTAGKQPTPPKAPKPPKAEKPAKASSAPKRQPKQGDTTENSVTPMEALTDEQAQARFLQHLRNVDAVEASQKAIIADARTKIAAARDKARSECGKTFMEQRALYRKLEGPDGRSVLESIFENQARLARWLDMPIGSTDDLFHEDRTPHLEKVFRDGKKSGMAGEGPTPPGHLDGLGKSKWTEGYHAGQAVNVGKLGTGGKAPPAFDAHAPKDEPTPADEPPKESLAEIHDALHEELAAEEADQAEPEIAQNLPADPPQPSLPEAFRMGKEARERGDGAIVPMTFGEAEHNEFLNGWNSTHSKLANLADHRAA